MISRELILLRHAQAEPANPTQDDAARALSARGRSDADAAGDWLRRQNAAPTLALCSPAARARETCDRVQALLAPMELHIDARIYEATPGALIRILDDHAASPSILLVGHNPGLEGLLALCLSGSSSAARGMPPAGIAWLRLPPGNLQPASAELRHFWWP